MDLSSIIDLGSFVTWCDYLGTLAFAISGIRLAAGRDLTGSVPMSSAL